MSAETLVDHVLRALDGAYLADSVDATFQDIAELARFKSSDQDIHQFRAKSKLVRARAERRLSAELPSVFGPAQLVPNVVGREQEVGVDGCKGRPGDSLYAAISTKTS